MAPVFTEQWAIEHRILEEKRTEDALRLAHSQRAKQTVYVYVWEHVCFLSVDLNIVEVSD